MKEWRGFPLPDLQMIIETYEDFPKPGVRFFDIGSIFNDPDSWQMTVAKMNERAIQAFAPDFLVGLESRGFPMVGAMACALGVGFAMCRKPGKLPGSTVSLEYITEYSKETLEIQPSKIKGNRVLIIDDVCATGGSIEATASLLRSIGKEPVGSLVVFDLEVFGRLRPLSVPLVSLYLK